MSSRHIDLTGQRFGRLIVIALDDVDKRGAHWRVRCDCGKEKIVASGELRRGATKSCGCFIREITSKRNRRHGQYNSPEYKTWRGMLTRCRNPKSDTYAAYGAIGVTVCERWLRFENFFADMGKKPSPDSSIDRIDNDCGYEPGNCRWLPLRQQQSNRRSNHYLTLNGETKTVAEWARETGLSVGCIKARIRKEHAVEFILRAPRHRGKRLHRVANRRLKPQRLLRSVQ